MPVEIELLPSGTLFKKDESLAVVVKRNQNNKGNSPPLPNMKTRYEHEDTVNRGNHLVYTGGGYDSRLIPPVIEYLFKVKQTLNIFLFSIPKSQKIKKKNSLTGF